jgi:tetratricopeptide (TPR) repeat protein
MRWFLLFCVLPGVLVADDHWLKYAAPPLEVYTDAGERAGRETMVRLQEFRHAVGLIVGEQELQTPEPVRILVFRNAKGWALSAPVSRGRNCYNIVLQEKSPISPDVNRGLTRLLLQSNTAQMPPAFEAGLVEFFSTLEVNGIRITAGARPARPDRNWARVHLLVTDPEYYGRLRVLLGNLRKGVDEEPSYRNAFGKSKAEIEEKVDAYFAAGNFPTTTLSSRPMSERDFGERQVSDADARLVRGDLLAGTQSAGEYQTLLRGHEKPAEAEEGMGLLALAAGRAEEAGTHFSAAMDAGSNSARCFIEYARLEPDYEKARPALLKAAGINPKLEEPFVLMAQRDTDPRLRLAHWKAATERNPRNPSHWKALAEAYLAQHNYEEAAKAWRGGEQAATDPAERERMRQSRMAIEEQRLSYEEAEKRRIAEEEARDLERLKSQARAEVRALEEKYNQGSPKTSSNVVPWWEGPKPSGKATGTLKQVDCLGTQARLVIDGDDRKQVKLLVADASKIAIQGGGEQTLGCGAQRPRRVTVEYFPKANARLATTGEVATIEFQ